MALLQRVKKNRGAAKRGDFRETARASDQLRGADTERAGSELVRPVRDHRGQSEPDLRQEGRRDGRRF
jgi:hypothetical protein